tara:strand:+ start:139 stop:1257 length:1119 start_codon:yes stop_codon:yes gene_type:complete
MKKNIKIYEMYIFYIVLFLILFGTIMQYSASYTLAINKFGWENYNYYFYKHMIRVVISLIAMIVMFNLNFTYLNKFSKYILIISWLCILSAYIFNEGSSTRRFLIINGRNIFTTSDFARFALIVFTASFITNNRKNINNLNIIATKYLSYISITLLLILMQPDLSSTFIISIILICMLLVGGLKLKYIAYLSTLGIIIISIAIKFNQYMQTRFINWFYNSNLDTTSQVERAKQALQNGGITGVGFSKSIIKEGFMAEGHTDFILPIIGEEIGLLGILLLFILFFSIYFISVNIAKQAPNIFSFILTIGISFNILFYFLINAGYVVGIIPPTGLAIPFISYGGSHTLFTLISIGTILNIAKYCNVYKYKYLRT